jgi:alpha-ketoglutarate-dependent taurine dioxygenase
LAIVANTLEIIRLSVANIVNDGNRHSYLLIAPDHAGESLLDIDAKWIEELYKLHGALLFRGFEFEIELFGQLTKKYCTHAAFNESPGRETIDAESNIQTVNLGDEAFPLHAELSRAPWKPDVCWFACVTPAERDGETYLCDGVEFVRQMSPELRSALENRKFKYTQLTQLASAKFWLRHDRPDGELLRNPPDDCPYSFEIIDQKPYQTFLRPVLHRTMFSDELTFSNFLLFSRKYLKNKAFPVFEDGSEIPDEFIAELDEIGTRLQQPIPWQENDVVMLDNTRFMHARDKLPSPSLRFILTYFGYLRFAVPSVDEGANPRWRTPHGLDGLFP